MNTVSIQKGFMIGKFWLMMMFVLGLSSCGFGSSSSNQFRMGDQAQEQSNDTSTTRTVTVIANIDAFSQTLHPLVIGEANCVLCHSSMGPGSPAFAAENVSTAFDAVSSVVDLMKPDASRIYRRVKDDQHNCWSDCDADAAKILASIERWRALSDAVEAVGSANSEETEVVGPIDPVTGDPTVLPQPEAANLTAFEQSLYPYLLGEAKCKACHTEQGPGTPAFASADATVASQSLLNFQKVNLAQPDKSRLYLRLKVDQHNCPNDCDADAVVMLANIEAWAALEGENAPEPEFNPLALASASVRFSAQEEQMANLRVSNGILAFYDFKEGNGNTATDSSGAVPALDLTLNDVQWSEGQGLEFNEGIAVASTEASMKLFEAITATNAYTFEAWIVPKNEQASGPARIITYSMDTASRNMTLGQVGTNLVLRNRTAAAGISNNGMPAIRTVADASLVVDELQHVVATFDANSGRKIYINGELVSQESNRELIDALEWSNMYQFALGNEITRNRAWQGTMKLVAVYNRALSIAEIQQNQQAGLASQVKVLKFDIAGLTGEPGTHIRLEAIALDDYSYKLSKPTVIYTGQGSFDLQGMRIAVNGVIPVAGQTFVNVSALVSESEQLISPLAAIITIDQGAELDRLTLAFEVIAGQVNVSIPQVIESSPIVDEAIIGAKVGIKTFDKINTSFAVITGVATDTPNIEQSYTELKQSLPSSVDPSGFNGAVQTVIAKLALEYCDQLLESAALRDDFFSGVNLNLSPEQALDSVGRAEIASLLYDKMFGVDLEGQPLASSARTELENLLNIFVNECVGNNCSGQDTRNAVKAACQASLSSAATLLH